MSGVGKGMPTPPDWETLVEGTWVLAPTTQRMHDGTVLRTWGVEADGACIGVAHRFGSDLAEHVVALQQAALFAASKRMAEVLREAANAFATEFDGDEGVDGGELVQWFAQWRKRARITLARIGAP